MDYNAKSSPPEEVHEKIKAKYAGIISRKMTVSHYDGKIYFEIMYFDESEKEWHIGYGSFALEFVQKWLEEEFEPTYKRIDEAITDLLARAEAAESRAEKSERERDAAIKELDEVAAAVDDLSDFIDEQIHPLVQYDMYMALRENADAISMWQYESEWSGYKEG